MQLNMFSSADLPSAFLVYDYESSCTYLERLKILSLISLELRVCTRIYLFYQEARVSSGKVVHLGALGLAMALDRVEFCRHICSHDQFIYFYLLCV